VARHINTCGVSTALNAPGSVQMLAAVPAATALFSLPDDADDSEARAHYSSDRPPAE